MTDQLFLFSDGSVDNRKKVGFGAFLLVDELTDDICNEHVSVKMFENTTSTRLELQTLLWACSNVKHEAVNLMVYTDSQNIIGLTERRNRLEKAGYRANSGDLLSNHDLYKEYFLMTDQLNINFIKVKGHMPFRQKELVDRIFEIVDKAARKALRDFNR